MPNDAKLGLVVGVGLVIVVAVFFFQRELTPSTPPADKAAATVVNPSANASVAPPRNQLRSAPAVPTARTEETAETVTSSRSHTVAEGDTLFSLAKQYYGDANKFTEIYSANRKVLKTPDVLPPGTVLVIPEMPEPAKETEETANP